MFDALGLFEFCVSVSFILLSVQTQKAGLCCQNEVHLVESYTQNPCTDVTLFSFAK